jgi:hypothetical protein
MTQSTRYRVENTTVTFNIRYVRRKDLEIKVKIALISECATAGAQLGRLEPKQMTSWVSTAKVPLPYVRSLVQPGLLVPLGNQIQDRLDKSLSLSQSSPSI